LRILAEELAAGRTDLRALAHRWVQHHRWAPVADPETATALDFLGEHEAPPADSPGKGSGPLGRVLPVALVALDSPRTVVSATFHIASLTHPDPEPAWAAVAINVALARLLRGKRDFVPEVIEALRGNAAPERLLAAVRSVPLPRRDGLPAARQAAGDAVAAAEVALRLAYHESILVRGLDGLAGAGPAAAGLGLAAGALLGARDGGDAVPPLRLPPPGVLQEWDDLADRLHHLAVPAHLAPITLNAVKGT
jgi:hypothetical protein